MCFDGLKLCSCSWSVEEIPEDRECLENKTEAFFLLEPVYQNRLDEDPEMNLKTKNYMFVNDSFLS